MLMLLFSLNHERYALKSEQIIEVVPLVELKKQPHAPNGIAGVFNYRGQIVPVLDLCQLIQGRACHAHLSTRIILVNYLPDRPSNEQAVSTLSGKDPSAAAVPTSPPCILGLMAERVVETLQRSEAELIDAEIQVETAPYLGKMLLDEQGMIQCIRIDALFTEGQAALLFASHDAVSR